MSNITNNEHEKLLEELEEQKLSATYWKEEAELWKARYFQEHELYKKLLIRLRISHSTPAAQIPPLVPTAPQEAPVPTQQEAPTQIPKPAEPPPEDEPQEERPRLGKRKLGDSSSTATDTDDTTSTATEDDEEQQLYDKASKPLPLYKQPGYKKPQRLCEGGDGKCPKVAVRKGLCYAHGAHKVADYDKRDFRNAAERPPPRYKQPDYKICEVDGCSKIAKRGTLCVDHRSNNQSTTDTNAAATDATEKEQLSSKNIFCELVEFPNGGRYICKIDGCTNRIINGGVCRRHGAKKILCSVEGCLNWRKNRGLCYKHGAKKILCSVQGCQNLRKKSGLCIKHGAYLTPPAADFQVSTASIDSTEDYIPPASL